MSSTRGVLSKGGAAGFTLIELLIVVVIVGLLASVAIPSFMRYLRQSRAVEVFENLEKIAAGAKLYFDQHHALPPDTGKSPARTLAQVCGTGAPRYAAEDLQDFDTKEWVNVLFRPGDGFRYRYEWDDLSALPSVIEGVARAEGDLDCDGKVSLVQIFLTREGVGEPLQRKGVFWVVGDDTE